MKEFKCPKCANAIFDPVWGELKCSKKQRSVKPELDADCADYKEGKPTESKIADTLPKEDD